METEEVPLSSSSPFQSRQPRAPSLDPERLQWLLDAFEEETASPETLAAASALCIEVLSRGTPTRARVLARNPRLVLGVRYGPGSSEVIRAELPEGAELLTSPEDDWLALVLPRGYEPDGSQAAAAPDVEPSWRAAFGAGSFTFVIPVLLGAERSWIRALERELSAEMAQAGAYGEATVHDARRGFAPRSMHPLESHLAGPLEGPASPFVPGQRLGAPGAEIELRARLGRGSMGEVWRGEGPQGPVAVKLALRPSFVRHLRQEGLLLAQVENPHVARFISADLAHDPPYLVTELVSGQPLRAQCRGVLPESNVVLLCDQLLDGLQAIHEAGILHLDLKPENVIVQPGGEIKIVDLGLGRATSRFMEEVYLSVSLVSRTPPVAGTLAYMSPEQRKGRELDPRADLFAFGILLHELLTGGLPSPGAAVSDVRPGLAPRWDVVVARLTHPDRQERPLDAADARLLVCYTRAPKLRRPVPRGGVRPRDLRSFDEASFALASPYIPGQVIGAGYELVHPLGRGGFGEVWRARRGEAEVVALKLILSEDARDGLAQEARVAARIEHERIPALLDDQSAADPAHLVFELVEGESLRLLINEREEPFPLGEALALFEGQVEVVQACAQVGVVHMDLKPEHFLVKREAGRPPQVTLIDFGLAALLDRSALEGSLASLAEIRGTLDYMAPEQREGRVGPAVDVFALGVCLFELLTLSLPRGPQGIRSIRSNVPGDLDELCLQMLARDPGGRPTLGFVREVVHALRFSHRATTPASVELGAVSPGQTLFLLRSWLRSALATPYLYPFVVFAALGILALVTRPGETGSGSVVEITPRVAVDSRLNLVSLRAQLAEVDSHSSGAYALYLKGLEGDAGAQGLALESCRAAPSAELAQLLAQRYLRGRGTAQRAALLTQGHHALGALRGLREVEPQLTLRLYLELASQREARVGALGGLVWALERAPSEVRVTAEDGARQLARSLLAEGHGLTPTQRETFLTELDRFLMLSPQGGQAGAAALILALEPSEPAHLRGLTSKAAAPWARLTLRQIGTRRPELVRAALVERLGQATSAEERARLEALVAGQ